MQATSRLKSRVCRIERVPPLLPLMRSPRSVPVSRFLRDVAISMHPHARDPIPSVLQGAPIRGTLASGENALSRRGPSLFGRPGGPAGVQVGTAEELGDLRVPVKKRQRTGCAELRGKAIGRIWSSLMDRCQEVVEDGRLCGRKIMAKRRGSHGPPMPQRACTWYTTW